MLLLLRLSVLVQPRPEFLVASKYQLLLNRAPSAVKVVEVGDQVPVVRVMGVPVRKEQIIVRRARKVMRVPTVRPETPVRRVHHR